MSDRSQLISTGEPFEFDKKRDAEFERLIKRYPTRESMILPALWLTQEQEGWVSQEAIGYIADRIGTFAAKVYEAATFYTMYNLKPTGKYHICVCRTLSCWLRGKQEIVDYLRDEVGVTPGKKTEDGKFSLEEVECLGHCGTAPVVQINGEFYENMDVEQLKSLLATLE
ncbi:NAD(P)H-dependent oxidoreductase subunit E [Desulforhopalus sp. IMCC35007]|jgi:NADH-quinone oxidoreductase subunit E|uniref:NADH-quinone oxidoreductase subunit NuoE family protein n=1 Tax=Desulforhopalus sp. IMCC35007 TaxID=2569543 RepID=UPI0010AEAC8B|nr:NAD(P)H-dependent oxidoreductase subunit E [Desulforhopalus sp. IMCC35007]TKB05781.1 NAD(P)H-dependent oxidoreductase subunit E [Desulforhopalus sp. IMCC35007]